MNSLQLQLSSSNVDSKNDNSFIFYIPTGSILAESQEHIYISVSKVQLFQIHFIILIVIIIFYVML